MKLADLRREGRLLANAIRSRDIDGVLQFMPKTILQPLILTRTFRGPKSNVSFNGAEALFYPVLFDSGQLQQLTGWEDAISLHEYFVNTKQVTIEVKVGDGVSPPEDPLFAVLSLRWNQRPPEGIYNPIMVYYPSGWKFATFFTQP